MGSKNRLEEVEDELGELERKCQRLANFLKSANNCMVYTGAGISTAAAIPDYRGPKTRRRRRRVVQGVWTLAGQGQEAPASCNPLDSEPTLTHMALRELNKRGYVRHVLSQNCDGLHLRSGLPQPALSEVHGNMYIEVCTKCEPQRQYIRHFDVTAATRFRRHATERRCDGCRAELRDTIVHFGEWGRLRWPLNWAAATELLDRGPRDGCDLILCLGSSLQILNKYPFLWASDRPKRDQPKLVIVNLQWTPKDRSATLKINGRCDFVMQKVMELLRLPIPQYCRFCDPVLGERRRRRRGQQLLSELTECVCPTASVYPTAAASSCSSSSAPCSSSSSSPAPSSSSSTTSSSRPGWWTAGLASMRKREGPKREGRAKRESRRGGKRARTAAPPSRPDSSDDDVPLAAFQNPVQLKEEEESGGAEAANENESGGVEEGPSVPAVWQAEMETETAVPNTVKVETGGWEPTPPATFQPLLPPLEAQTEVMSELKVKTESDEETKAHLASPFSIHQILSS